MIGQGEEKKEPKPSKTTITKTPIGYKYFVVFPNTIDDEAPEFLDLVNLLNKASEKDEVELVLNCRGGSVDTTVLIVNTIRESKATVTTILNGGAYSGGSCIFLAGDKKIVKPNSSFMAHYYSSEVRGKGTDLESRADFCKKQMGAFYRDIYKGFLSDKEIDDVLSGKDIWLLGTQVERRLKRGRGKKQ